MSSNKSGGSSPSLNKHTLSVYKSERTRELRSTKQSQGKDLTGVTRDKGSIGKQKSEKPDSDLLLRIAEQVNAEKARIKTGEPSSLVSLKEFSGLEVPLSARDIDPSLDSQNPASNKLETTPTPSLSVSEKPEAPINMATGDLRQGEREAIVGKTIQDYLISKGCITSDQAVKYLTSLHGDTISNLNSDIQIDGKALDLYIKGWLDCNQQMGSASLVTLSTKIDPMLNQMAQIMTSLRDNEVLKKIDDLKSLLTAASQPGVPAPPLGVSETLSRGKAPVSLAPEQEKDIQKTPPGEVPIMPENLKEDYQIEWKGLSSDKRKLLATWAGTKLLGKFNEDQMKDLQYQKKIAGSITGAGLIYLLRLNTAKTNLTIIQKVASEMYKRGGGE